MNQRQTWSKFFSALAILAMTFSLAGPALAAQETPQAPAKMPLPMALRGQTGPVTVMVELTDPSAVVVYTAAASKGQIASATVSAQAQLTKIEAAQQSMLKPLASLDAQVLYANQRVYNGLVVRVDASRLAAIQALPGVKSIVPVATQSIDNSSSVPLIGAPEVWAQAGTPYQGDNIKVGVIDTGIDYYHADFGGADGNPATGDSQAITKTAAGFPTNPLNGLATFTGTTWVPNAKVVGGYDFAGDDYDADSQNATYQPIPHPDADPMDCYGHGSHVAGTIAGFGVTSAGASYNGAYDASAPYSVNLRIGPGVAPKALLYSLRVFGCNGSTDLTDQAIEWAVDPNKDGDFSDHLDVINMSLGSSFGSAVDSSAIASDNAAALGVIVVASAGNSNDVYYVAGSPSNSSRTISVASSVDANSYAGQLPIEGIAGGPLFPAAENTFAPDLGTTGPLSGTVVVANPLIACTALSNAAAVAGKIALIQRGTCAFADKVAQAQLAGAKGVLIFQNAAGLPITMGGTPTIVTAVTIPAMMTDLTTGRTVSNTVGAGGTVTVTLTAAYRNTLTVSDPTAVDTLSTFSSRGPRRLDSMLKPDISAPGDTILSVKVLSGDERESMSGTSMAAPHMAGVMALLRQAHPTWSVEQLKAAAMNTAVNDLRASATLPSAFYGPARVGAGRVDVPSAADTGVVAYNITPGDDAGLVSVSFGAPEVASTLAMTKTIKVENLGASAQSYWVEYLPATDMGGVSYSVPVTQITVNANSFRTIPVSLKANALQMTRAADPTVAKASRQWLSEESGWLVLTPKNVAFGASLSGAEAVPAVTSTVLGGVVNFTYNASTNTLSWNGFITSTGAYSITGATVRAGQPGQTGAVMATLVNTNTNLSAGTPITVTGSATVTATGERLLLAGDTYVAVATASKSAGEVRGQVNAGQVIMLNSLSAQAVVPSIVTALRVPLYAAPRAVAAMYTPASSVNLPSASGSFDLPLVSASPSITFPGNSLVTALELQLSDPNEPSTSGPTDAADVQYVGIASDAPAAAFNAASMIYFGLSSYGNWSTPSDTEFDVYIDTNRDGHSDFVVFNWNLGAFGGGSATDRLISAIVNLSTGGLVDWWDLNYDASPNADTAVFNNNVMVMPVQAADLNLTSGNATFDYYVVSFSREGNGAMDVTAKATYNAENPGLDLTGGSAGDPIYLDLPGQSITVNYNTQWYNFAGSLGVLLLHHHNPTGARAEVIPLTTLANGGTARINLVNAAPYNSGSATLTMRLTGASGAVVGGNSALAAPTTITQTLAFGQSTGYLTLPANSYAVDIFEAGVVTPVVSSSITLAADNDYTAVAAGNDALKPLSFWLLNDSVVNGLSAAAIPAGSTNVRLVNAAPLSSTTSATAVDLRSAGALVGGLTGLTYGSNAVVTLPSGVLPDLRVTSVGGGVTYVRLGSPNLISGGSTTLFIIGDGVNQPLANLVNAPAGSPAINYPLYIPFVKR